MKGIPGITNVETQTYTLEEAQDVGPYGHSMATLQVSGFHPSEVARPRCCDTHWFLVAGPWVTSHHVPEATSLGI